MKKLGWKPMQSATMPDRGPHLPTLLLVALLVVAALSPPELSAAGFALAVALSAGAGLLRLARSVPESRQVRGEQLSSRVLFVYLLLSVLFSSQPHQSLTVLAGAAFGLIAFHLAKETPTAKGREIVLASVAASASLAAARGLYQKLFGLAATARELRGLGQAEWDPHVLRAESGRAFGPFLLPSALGIYLAMAIPITVRFWIRSSAGSRLRIVWGTLVVLQAGGICASLSYGALVALLAGTAVLAFLAPRPRRGTILAVAAVLGLVAIGGFLLSRGGEGASPLMLRARNWVAALRIFSREPLLGVGFGNFRDAYPMEIRQGMNETAYAHNSYLQVAAEGGVLGLAGVVAGVTAFAFAARRRFAADPDRVGRSLLLIPPVAFLTHNLFDFSAYLPSLSLPFAALAGLALGDVGSSDGSRQEAGQAPPPGRFPRAALGLLLLGFAIWGLREAWVRSLLDRGREAIAAGRVEQATAALMDAGRLSPSDPDPPSALAEIYLTRMAGRPEERARGEAWALRSVALRPRRAYGHFLVALYRLHAGDRGEAWVEISRARLLYPFKELYRSEEARLKALLGREGAREPDGGR